MKTIQQGILLITIDCGRRDSVYGPEVLTPHIDRFRDEAITFQNAFSQSATTLPSLYSLFLSQYVSRHGVLSNVHYKDLDENSLPHLLVRNGWTCRAFTGFSLLHLTFGRDFMKKGPGDGEGRADRLIKKVKRRSPPFLAARLERSIFKRNRIPAQVLVKEALKYLNASEGKVFLWLHFFDAHMEYHAPGKWVKYYDRPSTSAKESVYHQLKAKGIWFPEQSFGALLKVIRDIHYYPALYRAALSHIDEQIGHLFEGMKRMGVYDRFSIILTSDHGENLFDHGMYCCHFKLFPNTTHVPLMIKLLDFTSRESSGMVEHIDLFPTLCERFSLKLPENLQGKSLLPLITRKEEIHPYVYSEHMRLLQRMVASKEWHYLFSDPSQGEWFGLKFEESYLIRREKGDLSDLSDRFPEVCNELERIANKTISKVPTEPVEERERLEGMLRSLGYL